MKIIGLFFSLFLISSLVFPGEQNSTYIDSEKNGRSSGYQDIEGNLSNECRNIALGSTENSAPGIPAKIPERIHQVHYVWIYLADFYRNIYYILVVFSIVFGTVAASSIVKDDKDRLPWKSIFILLATIATGLNASIAPELHWRKYEEAASVLHLAIASHEARGEASDVCAVLFAAYDGEKLIHDFK